MWCSTASDCASSTNLAAADRPFRPGLRVKGVAAHPGVFEMT